jgi:membrane protein DedA with SNARE-associated domain
MEQAILEFITGVFAQIGWGGVVVLMAIESACIPLPSEIIMPLSGWMLIQANGLPMAWVLAAGGYGALGCTIGSVIAYYVGYWGGRPFLERWGKYLLISPHDLELADRWFKKYGSWAAFFSRLLPVVRTFISLPAGMARSNIYRFVIFSFLGSFPWCAGLAWGGYLLGDHWESLRSWMRPLDPVIITVILGLVGYYIYRHVRRFRRNRN